MQTNDGRQQRKWQVQLSALEAGGPTLGLPAHPANRNVKTSVIGDVWLCSGQSNMEWSVAQANNYKQEREER
ncbi:MAG: hypothetical protein IPL27_15050 [Lewinellaceae bacterium]|nr:hypothetical protein [Lewinellaceae bacterium]